jgi:DNA end-binding protein Ku
MATTVWKGYLTFGLVSIPVRLYAAARGKTLPFHLLHKKDHARVKEVLYCREEDRPLTREQIVRGYEVRKDQYVVVEDAELAKIAPPTAHVMEIQQFVKASQVDPLFFDKSYHVMPEAKITRPYALLLEALKQTKHFGVAKLTMHNREHIVILRPGRGEIVLHTMFFVDEVRKAEPVDLGQQAFKPKELELATRLIETLTATFRPEQYHDEYQENVKRLVEQKQKGQKVKSIAKPRVAPVVDLVQALQRSLNQQVERDTPARRGSKRRGPAKRRAA